MNMRGVSVIQLYIPLTVTVFTIVSWPVRIGLAGTRCLLGQGVNGVRLPIILLTVACMSLLSPFASAQLKFTPEHPQVEEMVQRGVRALEGIGLPAGGGYQVLAALAIAESSKRYDGVVPTEHAIVKKAVGKVLEDVENGKLERSDSIYYPALALILLCDCGRNKYENEINTLIKQLVERQESFGGFSYTRNKGRYIGDTSQTQYASLAFWVAHRNGFSLPLEAPGRALQFYLDVNLNNGAWAYEYEEGRPVQNEISLSIQAASLGTVYLLSDFLRLTKRSASRSATDKKKIAEDVKAGLALPPSVSVYVPPNENGFSPVNQTSGPLFKIDRGRLAAVKGAGNRYLANNFEIFLERWGYYYLYAMERYAFFRTRAEGSMGSLGDWYDQGVELLMSRQLEDGTFKPGRSGEKKLDALCFAILFLVRSSEVLVPVGGEGNLNGSIGLPSDVRMDVVDGRVRAFNVVEGFDSILELLGNEDLDEQQYSMIREAMGKSLGTLGGSGSRDQREYLGHLRGLISDRNYFKRLLAVQLLARQQEMDNVPALIYALGDPDLRICDAAHNGLRLISRKLDSIKLNGEPGYAEYQRLKEEWTEWFLRIRPGAVLLD